VRKLSWRIDVAELAGSIPGKPWVRAFAALFSLGSLPAFLGAFDAASGVL